MVKIQYTLFCTTGKYKPISTIIEVPSVSNYKEEKEYWNKRAIRRITAARNVNAAWIKENGYTQYKVRVYDKEKIEKEKAERYEQIKKERGWT